MTNKLSKYDEHPDGKALLANIHLAEATTAATAWVLCWTEHELGTGIPQMNTQRRKTLLNYSETALTCTLISLPKCTPVTEEERKDNCQPVSKRH